MDCRHLASLSHCNRRCRESIKDRCGCVSALLETDCGLIASNPSIPTCRRGLAERVPRSPPALFLSVAWIEPRAVGLAETDTEGAVLRLLCGAPDDDVPIRGVLL